MTTRAGIGERKPTGRTPGIGDLLEVCAYEDQIKEQSKKE
jgi:hypothetical protein